MIPRSDEDKHYTSSTELITVSLFPDHIIVSPEHKIKETSEQKIIEIPEQKATEQKINTNVNFQSDEFVAVNLWPSDKLNVTPNKVLALDVDETIIDYEASKKNDKLVFINFEKLKQKIAYAKEHNIVIVIVTSRKFDPITDTSYLSVNNIVKELGMENFDYIFYTNGKCKSMVMQKLWDFYYRSSTDKLKDLCLIDDADRFLRDCLEKNFMVIKANKNDTHSVYLDEMQNFMDGTFTFDPKKLNIEEKKPEIESKFNSLFMEDSEEDQGNITLMTYI